MPEHDLDYAADVTIDTDALDVEWLRQPQLMLKYCRHAASMANLVDITKERLDVVRAQLDKDIRSDPGKYGIEKLTEGAIQNALILVGQIDSATEEGEELQSTLRPYQEASSAYIQAKYESDMAKAAVRAIDQKKDALENLVRLHGQQYFAGPSVPRDLSKEWEERERSKRVDAKIAKAMKRTKEEK